jgi:AcrR family transcriptional regulator
MRKPRRYDSTGRREGAARTRRSVLEAARRLFAARGIDQVTVAALAEAAGVSPATIYALFRSKAGILRALMEEALFNDAYRPLAERARQVRDPAEMLQLTASIARAIYDGERAGLGVVRGAGAFSAELRAVEQQFERRRFELQRPRAERIARRGTVRPGLTLRQVRDVLWMFTSRDVYRMLVVERRWSPTEYQAWLSGALGRTLLA